jgi:hypothetical protein
VIGSRRFKPSDAKYIQEWLEARGMGTNVSDLPENGVLVTDLDRPVAIGFIRRCEGGVALIDSAITNPNAQPGVRDKAMDRLTKDLIDLSSHLEITRVLAFSTDGNTLLRAQKFGFQRLPYAVISLTTGNK